MCNGFNEYVIRQAGKMSLVKSKSCGNPEDQRIGGYKKQCEAEPGKDFQIVLQEVIPEVPESFQINLFKK